MSPVVVFFVVVGFLSVSLGCCVVLAAMLANATAWVVRRHDDTASAQHIEALGRELADLEDLWRAS